MKQKLVILYGILCLILLYACEKEVPYPPQDSNKLVVSSYICPGKDIIVDLSLSRSYYGKVSPSIGLISNASVTISDGASPITIPWNGRKEYYTLDASQLPIVEGKTYSLNVNVPSIGSASAQTTVPQPIVGGNFKLLEVKKNPEKRYDPVDIYSYQFSVPNSPSLGSYYRFYPTIEIGGISQTSASYDVAFNNPADGDPYLQEYAPSTGPLEIVLNLTKKYSVNNNSSLTSTTSLTHTGHLISCSKDYYLFYKTVQQNAGLNPKNPFIQFSNVYSNIRGGYGIFAGYNEVVITENSTYGN